jgi:surface protein
MFRDATSFNQNINSWDVSSFGECFSMFFGATSFNQPLDNWDMSNAFWLSGMFRDASSFNQPIGNWNLSNAEFMGSMFKGASSFNQPIDSWDMSNVTEMDEMFRNATSFNQDISSWCVEDIPAEPTLFSDNSPLQNIFIPIWGATCTLSVFENSLEDIKIYPNPVQNQLFLTWSSYMISDQLELGIYDISGKLVFNETYVQNPSQIDVSQLANGIYFLKVSSRNQTTVKRIIKK